MKLGYYIYNHPIKNGVSDLSWLMHFGSFSENNLKFLMNIKLFFLKNLEKKIASILYGRQEKIRMTMIKNWNKKEKKTITKHFK